METERVTETTENKRDENPQYREYLTYQQQVQKFLRSFLRTHCVPSCSLIECTNWSRPSSMVMDNHIGCTVWLLKKNQHGTVDFNLSRMNTAGDMQFSFNDLQILRLTTNQCKHLLSLEEGPVFDEALQRLSDQKFMTTFPNPTIGIRAIE